MKRKPIRRKRPLRYYGIYRGHVYAFPSPEDRDQWVRLNPERSPLAAHSNEARKALRDGRVLDDEGDELPDLPLGDSPHRARRLKRATLQGWTIDGRSLLLDGKRVGLMVSRAVAGNPRDLTIYGGQVDPWKIDALCYLLVALLNRSGVEFEEYCQAYLYGEKYKGEAFVHEYLNRHSTGEAS